MRNSFLWLVAGVAILSFLISSPVQAQPYAINWWIAGGGGGTSTGGGYALSGTIGQPATGKLSGGRYSVDGGFWSALGTYFLYLPLIFK
jgi:hypothetical protein